MKIEPGMKVRITKSNVTHDYFRCTQEMLDMVGKIVTVENVFTSSNGYRAVEIGEWTWSPDDLKPVLQPLDIKEEKKEVIIFDPKDLVL